jgi:hypothetical protein
MPPVSPQYMAAPTQNAQVFIDVAAELTAHDMVNVCPLQRQRPGRLIPAIRPLATTLIPLPDARAGLVPYRSRLSFAWHPVHILALPHPTNPDLATPNQPIPILA